MYSDSLSGFSPSSTSSTRSTGSAQKAPTPAKHEAPKPPDVRGLNLLDPDAVLAKHKYATTVVEKDVAFGVYVRDNFVVCEQEEPKGRLVPVKIAKDGC